MTSLLRIPLFLLFFLGLPHFGQAQKNLRLTFGKLLGKTPPLSSLASVPYYPPTPVQQQVKQLYSSDQTDFEEKIPIPSAKKGTALPHGPDPLHLSSFEKNLSTVTPVINVDGIDQEEAIMHPPDPVGDVSPEYYVQATNSSFGTLLKIFNKQGMPLLESFPTNLLWQSVNALSFADPILLWDQSASRWLLGQMGFSDGVIVLLVAVSETADPFESWYAYKISAPAYPDYPKLGIWPDSYLITTNEVGSNIPVYALHRAAMLAGEEDILIQRIEALPKFVDPDAFQVATPADWDGPQAPPSDTKPMVLRIYDDAWEGGQDAVELWSFDIDWDNPDNTLVQGPQVIPLAPFKSSLCVDNLFNCLQQPAPPFISALQQVIMHRVQYRRFDEHESIVFNFTVDVSGDLQAGIRWCELRKENDGSWVLFQEGTYAPDANNRFQGSIAMDGQGNLLMGYSYTGPDHFLSTRFTGRKADDPPGQMTITETETAKGQSNSPEARWGDYASMSIDPISDRTFWFTGPYMKENEEWGTNIFSANIERDTNDIGPVALLSPLSSGLLSEEETIRVAIRNLGCQTQNDFQVYYQFQNGPFQMETINQELEPDSTYIHTFSTSVNMEALGIYSLTVFTSLDSDSAPSNDTLKAQVEKYPRFDAALVDVEGLENPFCENSLTATLIWSNEGTDTLQEVKFELQINNIPVDTLFWTGLLPPDELAELEISLHDYEEGANSLTITAFDPNGNTDQRPENNSLSSSFFYGADYIPLRLELLTDLFPHETSWQLEDENGMVLYESDLYTEGETLYLEEWCLPPGCYTFRIQDVLANGLSAFGVEGHYAIVNADNDLSLTSILNINFGSEESNTFCLSTDCMLEAEITAQQPPSGAIFLNITNGNPPFSFSIDGGVTSQLVPFFIDLEEGDYSILIQDASGCIFETAVILDDPLGTIETNRKVQLKLSPNPAKEWVQITLEGWIGAEHQLPVQLLSTSGQFVRHGTLSRFDQSWTGRLPLGGLSPGVYYLNLRAKDFQHIAPLVISP
jgi:hypothetical protein